MSHETNIKNTTVLALTRCLLEREKNEENIQQMTGIESFIWTGGSVFVPFESKENQEETKRPSLDSESGSSYFFFSMSILCERARKKEWRTCVVLSELPGSAFTVSARADALGLETTAGRGNECWNKIREFIWSVKREKMSFTRIPLLSGWNLKSSTQLPGRTLVEVRGPPEGFPIQPKPSAFPYLSSSLYNSASHLSLSLSAVWLSAYNVGPGPHVKV